MSDKPVTPLPEETPAVANSILEGLGQSLRWLRDRIGRKQYQVAQAAGITKGMLSAYETGRQKPSLETLDKLLATLNCDLHDLHNAIQIVNGRPGQMRSAAAGGGEAAFLPRAGFPDLYRILGQSERLPPELERALQQILDGFHQLLRYVHRSLPRQDEPGEPEGELS